MSYSQKRDYVGEYLFHVGDPSTLLRPLRRQQTTGLDQQGCGGPVQRAHGVIVLPTLDIERGIDRAY